MKATTACTTSSGDEVFTYDDAGNRRTVVAGSTTWYRYSGAGQLCQSATSDGSCPADPATWPIPYDDAGRTRLLDGWTLAYDGEGRLASACRVAGCATGDMVTMRYDGEGRRVELVVRPNGGAAVTTTFRYQGTSIAQELSGGVLARTYLTDEAGTIVRVCDPDCTGANPAYLVTYNGHGDALALWRIGTDGTLTLANSFSYSTWGAPTAYNAAGTALAWNDAANLRFRFLYVGAHGVAWDDFGLGLGLLYMSARHYHPGLGRFLQPDPSALEANLYAYAGNSPVTMVDPSGLCASCRIWSYARSCAYGLYRRGRLSYNNYLRVYYYGLRPFATTWPLSVYSYRYQDTFGCQVCMNAYMYGYGLGCAAGTGLLAAAACSIVPGAGTLVCGVLGSVAGYVGCAVSWLQMEATDVFSARSVCRTLGACPPFGGGSSGGGGGGAGGGF